jgi:hypothetical protein
MRFKFKYMVNKLEIGAWPWERPLPLVIDKLLIFPLPLFRNEINWKSFKFLFL